MRHAVRWAALVCAALLTVFVLAACGDDEDTGAEATKTTEKAAAAVPFESPTESGLPVGYPEPKPKALRIGFASPLQASEPIKVLDDSMKATAKALGGQLITLDANMDVDRQVSNIEQLIARQVDAIVVFPIDAKAVVPAVKKAKDAGIPAVAIEYDNKNPQNTGPFDTQILQGTDRLAYLQVKAMADALGKGGKVVQVGISLPAPTLVSLTANTKKWAQKFGLDYLGRADNATDDIAGGQAAMTGLLARHPDAEGVLAYNDASAIGAAAAARSARNDIVAFGNYGGAPDGISAIDAGRIQGTVLFDQPGVGKFAVWGAYDLAEGQKLPKAVLPGPPQIVTEKNVGAVLEKMKR